jgi:hypothetical protein
MIYYKNSTIIVPKREISKGALLSEATFKNPYEFFAQMSYVDVNLAEIWIYDRKSGEIISKIKSR